MDTWGIHNFPSLLDEEYREIVHRVTFTYSGWRTLFDVKKKDKFVQ